jgi:hypothetical protein
MPSHLHEVLVDMFHERPALAADLLSDSLGMPLPPLQTAVLSSAHLTDLLPTEYRLNSVRMPASAIAGPRILQRCIPG